MSALAVQPVDPIEHSVTLAASEVHQIPVQAVQQTPQNGFVLDLTLSVEGEPDNNPAATTLLELDGALTLVREGDGRVSLVAQTDSSTDSSTDNNTDTHPGNETVTLTSAQRVNGTHHIEVHLIDGLLSFSVDDEREEAQLRDATLRYNQTGTYTLTAPAEQTLQISALVFDTPAQTPTARGVAVDDTGLHRATTRAIRLIKDAPMQVGNSYRVAAGGQFSAARTAAISPDDALGLLQGRWVERSKKHSRETRTRWFSGYP